MAHGRSYGTTLKYGVADRGSQNVFDREMDFKNDSAEQLLALAPEFEVDLVGIGMFRAEERLLDARNVRSELSDLAIYWY